MAEADTFRDESPGRSATRARRAAISGPLGRTSGTYLCGRRPPRRGFALVEGPNCQGWLLSVVKNPVSIARYLAAVGELTDVRSRTPDRGPPYWKSRVLRLRAAG